MNTRLFSLWLALIPWTVVSRAETIVSVDPETKLISLKTGAGYKAYKLADKVDIRVGTAVADLEKLEPGATVIIGLLDTQTINRIVVTPPPKPGAFIPAGRPAERLINLKLRVDGTEVVKVKDGMLWIEHKADQLPTDLSINGHAWKPKWDEDKNKSNAFIGFTGPLATFEGAKVVLTKSKGRGKVKITEQPSEHNNHTLEVEFSDQGPDGGGSDVYEVKITW
jgi:hypothetical protein